jgi:uncharacterized protein involved in type VI secretion and phage assembly
MAKLTDFLGRPHSGVVPHAVIGIVTDNKDPDKLGRVKVKFPTLMDGSGQPPLSTWLRVASPNGGKERGFYAIPEVDDEVLVLFLLGSQDVGVIIGQFWNGVDKPPKEADAGMPGGSATDTGGGLSTEKPKDGSGNYEKNDRRLWRSRSGHLFVFDDSSGKESVQIWDKSLKLSLVFDSAGKIFLANAAGDIHIRAKQNIFLEAGQNIKFKSGQNYELEAGQNIKFKAAMDINAEAQQNFKVKASMNVQMDASVDFKVKASANAKLEGSVNFEAKGGASAKVEGSGTCTIKGGMVSIN